MNLFILDQDPIKAAQNQINKHIIKMPSEVANLLLWPFKLDKFTLPNNKQGTEVKLSHLNHPASLWVRESKENFDWAFCHLGALLLEYEFRYNREHYAKTYFNFIGTNSCKLKWNKKQLTPFARCFSTYKQELDSTKPNTVEAYRKFYIKDKEEFARWPAVNIIPSWWIEQSEKYVDPSFKNGVYTKRQ